MDYFRERVVDLTSSDLCFQNSFGIMTDASFPKKKTTARPSNNCKLAAL